MSNYSQCVNIYLNDESPTIEKIIQFINTKNVLNHGEIIEIYNQLLTINIYLYYWKKYIQFNDKYKDFYSKTTCKFLIKHTDQIMNTLIEEIFQYPNKDILSQWNIKYIKRYLKNEVIEGGEIKDHFKNLAYVLSTK